MYKHGFNTQVKLQRTFSLLWTDYEGFFCLPFFDLLAFLPSLICLLLCLALICLLSFCPDQSFFQNVCFSVRIDLSAFLTALIYLLFSLFGPVLLSWPICFLPVLTSLLSACLGPFAFLSSITCLLFRFLYLLFGLSSGLSTFLPVLTCHPFCLSWHVCFSDCLYLYDFLGNEKNSSYCTYTYCLLNPVWEEWEAAGKCLYRTDSLGWAQFTDYINPLDRVFALACQQTLLLLYCTHTHQIPVTYIYLWTSLP